MRRIGNSGVNGTGSFAEPIHEKSRTAESEVAHRPAMVAMAIVVDRYVKAVRYATAVGGEL